MLRLVQSSVCSHSVVLAGPLASSPFSCQGAMRTFTCQSRATLQGTLVLPFCRFFPLALHLHSRNMDLCSSRVGSEEAGDYRDTYGRRFHAVVDIEVRKPHGKKGLQRGVLHLRYSRLTSGHIPTSCSPHPQGLSFLSFDISPQSMLHSWAGHPL